MYPMGICRSYKSKPKVSRYPSEKAYGVNGILREKEHLTLSGKKGHLFQTQRYEATLSRTADPSIPKYTRAPVAKIGNAQRDV